ncbi:MAG: PHB depolymerase family esterase [Geminicoccaceae bacterium]
MNAPRNDVMGEATALVRAGRVAEATALLRRELGRTPADDRVAPATPPPTMPQGASFRAAVHRNAAGSRAYKLYVPAASHARPLPLLVMLHGCTQTPDDFAAGTRMNELAEDLGFLAAYPAQARAANSSGCWNWFRAADQERDRGEPSLLAGITREVLDRHPVDGSRVYIAGMSAGGAAAAVMAAAYPDLYAAVGIHSGLPVGVAGDLQGALAAMRGGPVPGSAASPLAVPAIVFHGDTDPTVHPGNADAIVAQVRAGLGGTVQPTATVLRGQRSGGRSYRRIVHADRSGRPVLEQWTVHGAGHAWSGGSPAGSYTDAAGPDASRAMLRFFLQHRRGSAT